MHLVGYDLGAGSERADHLRRDLGLALAHVVLAEEELAVQVAGLNCVQVDLWDGGGVRAGLRGARRRARGRAWRERSRACGRPARGGPAASALRLLHASHARCTGPPRTRAAPPLLRALRCAGRARRLTPPPRSGELTTSMFSKPDSTSVLSNSQPMPPAPTHSTFAPLICGAGRGRARGRAQRHTGVTPAAWRGAHLVLQLRRAQHRRPLRGTRRHDALLRRGGP
jgi:hypothetical protein